MQPYSCSCLIARLTTSIDREPAGELIRLSNLMGKRAVGLVLLVVGSSVSVYKPLRQRVDVAPGPGDLAVFRDEVELRRDPQ